MATKKRRPGNNPSNGNGSRARSRSKENGRASDEPQTVAGSPDPSFEPRRLTAAERFEASRRVTAERVGPLAKTVRARAAAAGRGIADAGSRAVGTVTANPVPSVMIGAGLAWLLAQQVNRRTQFFDRASKGITRAAGRIGETLADTAGTVGGRVGETAGVVGEAVREGTSRVGEFVQSGVSAAGVALEGTRSALEEGTRYGRDAAKQAWTNHPLAVGATVLAAGMAAGLMLPRTRAEQRAMGRASQEVSRAARAAGENLLKRGQKAAAAAVDASSRQARRMGLTPRELERKAERMVESVRAAAANAAAE